LSEAVRDVEGGNDIDMARVWAMPNKKTFEIPPIAKLLVEEMGREEFWIDPFAGEAKAADCTNDLNPKFDTDYNMEATQFLAQFDDASVDGVLYDPPYSPRQIKECYDGIGLEMTRNTTQCDFWSEVEEEIARVVRTGGKVISFGWLSAPIGKMKGFEINRILLVAHGGRHNDTICTVEQKVKKPLSSYSYD